jgi:hypothetical protein
MIYVNQHNLIACLALPKAFGQRSHLKSGIIAKNIIKINKSFDLLFKAGKMSV